MQSYTFSAICCLVLYAWSVKISIIHFLKLQIKLYCIPFFALFSFISGPTNVDDTQTLLIKDAGKIQFLYFLLMGSVCLFSNIF